MAAPWGLVAPSRGFVSGGHAKRFACCELAKPIEQNQPAMRAVTQAIEIRCVPQMTIVVFLFDRHIILVRMSVLSWLNRQ
jgi:hypothetical protein